MGQNFRFPRGFLFTAAAICLAFAAAPSAHADLETTLKGDVTEWRDRYLTVSAVTTTQTASGRLSAQEAIELGFPTFDLVGPVIPSLPAPTTSPIAGIIGKIIPALSGGNLWVTIGEKIWQIVVAGRPVANVQNIRVSVLPVVQADWASMEHWQGPTVLSYSVVAHNLLGMEVVRVDYRVIYNYAGQLAGKGAYLANLTIQPTTVSVLWGYQLDVSVEAASVVNTATAASPVPGLEMQLTCLIGTLVKHTESRTSFFVKGTGESRQL